jgi:hypothetical protein
MMGRGERDARTSSSTSLLRARPSAIETGGAFVEVETGLKRRVDDLQERIAKLKTAKPFVVLAPDEAVAEEYRRKLVNDRVALKTLREFLLDGGA